MVSSTRSVRPSNHEGVLTTANINKETIMTERPHLPLEYFRAHRQATKAVQRGDIPAANKWMDIIERMLKIAEREQALTHPQARAKTTR